MESVSFTSTSVTRNNFLPNSVVPLIKSKTTGFTDAAETLPGPVMASGSRLLCFTTKKPSELRVLDRINAKKAELTSTFNVAFIASLAGDALFAIAGDHSVALIETATHPDGNLTMEQKQIVTLEESVRNVCAAGNSSALVLTSAGRLVTVKADGTTTAGFAIPAAAKGALKSSVLAVHKEAALAIVPGKGAALDIVSLNSEKSILAKPWMPHGDDTPSSAHIFQARTFEGQQENGRFIVTGANNNTELRFWALSEDKNVSLVQQLTINTIADGADGEEAAATATDDDRLISVTSDEEYIVLASRKTGSVVVVEMHRQQFKPTRVTDWNPSGALCVCSPFIRKVQDGKSLTMDLAAVVRTSEMISVVTFDAGRLVGASNVNSSGALAAAPTSAAASSSAKSSVSKWFGGNDVAAAPSAASPAAVSAPVASPLPTSVSSSIAGRFSATNNADSSNQYVTGQAVSAIKNQTGHFRDALASIDEQIVNLQKQASVALKALQDAKSKDDAQLAGREFALRNKNRLNAAAAGSNGSNSNNGPSGNSMTPAQIELMHGLRSFVDSLAPSVRDASGDTCRKILAQTLPSAVSRTMNLADTADQDIALPDISVTKGMQTFGLAVDKIHQSQNNTLKIERNQVEQLSVRLMQGGDRITKTIVASKAFMAQLKAEMSGLRTDVREANDAVRSSGSKSSAIAAISGSSSSVSIEKVLEEAARLVQSGKWSDAVALVERTGEITALVQFLISVEDSASVLVDPHTLPITLMTQVCYRLALDLRGQIGNAATRCKWIHDFLVDWDETLLACKANDAKTFSLISEPLEAVFNELSGIDVRKDVDRATKNRISLCKRLLGSLQ
jgi:hypothetical protein